MTSRAGDGTAPGRGAAGVVYVVVLNWNGWRDTIPCLESVLRSRGTDFQVVVCDNESSDGSLDRLTAWARGAEAPPHAEAGDRLAALFTPPVAKPVPHVVLTREQAERGGTDACRGARVVFVSTGGNLGYAGGCNVGLRYAIARGDCAHAWLLNNDAVVPPESMAALVRRLEGNPRAGLCGSRVLFYDEPEVIQCLGGASYGRWLAVTSRVGEGAPAGARVDPADVERRLACVYGASVMTTAAYLRDVGLLEESYFMYFEELDWAARAAGRYTLAYADDSVVYHREGRSGGAHHDARRRSAFADLQVLRNRLRFTRRFYPAALPTVYLGILAVAARRALIGEFRRAAMVLHLAVGGTPAGVRAGPAPSVQPRLAPHGEPGA